MTAGHKYAPIKFYFFMAVLFLGVAVMVDARWFRFIGAVVSFWYGINVGILMERRKA